MKNNKFVFLLFATACLLMICGAVLPHGHHGDSICFAVGHDHAGGERNSKCNFCHASKYVRSSHKKIAQSHKSWVDSLPSFFAGDLPFRFFLRLPSCRYEVFFSIPSFYSILGEWILGMRAPPFGSIA